MAVVSAGQLLVNSALPKDLRRYDRPLVGGDLEAVLAEIGHRDPELYRDVSFKLMDIGREQAYYNGTTIGIDDLTQGVAVRKQLMPMIRKAEAAIDADTTLTDDERREKLGAMYDDIQEKLVKNTLDEAVAKGNALGLQVMSKSRGNPTQLASVLSTPGAFRDNSGKSLGAFVDRSYSEGLRPWEYYMASFGARRGVISTKFATRDAGDLGKQMNTVAAGLRITEDDCGTLNGIPVDANDNDNIGAVLAIPSMGLRRNQALDTKFIKGLKDSDPKEIVVRSPLTCQSQTGICKMCAGKRETGDFPELGEAIGIKSTSALSERIAQGALNTKHTGGQKGKEKQYAGFNYIDQIAQMPETFNDGAAVSSVDGNVDRVEPAPQGGTHVFIGDAVHYILPQLEATVKVGDTVEAGDQLSSGLLNPADVVKYKGLGEGRRYFTQRFTKAFKDSGLTANRRNVEVLARAFINNVEVTAPNGVGDYLPGDVVRYSALAHSYRPRETAKRLPTGQAIGKYLETPVLHHTIGTRVTKKLTDQLSRHGIDQVIVDDDEPDFSPTTVRMQTAGETEPDWMAKLQGTYLMQNLSESAQLGSTSNIHGTHPVPAIAYGAELGRSPTSPITF